MATDEPNVELASVELVPAAPTSELVKPQLRLHHLFALTAVMAILLAVGGQQPNYYAGSAFAPPPLMQTIMVGGQVLYIMLTAVAVTAVGYGIAWQRKGLAFFHHPGHWLLAEIAVTALFSLPPIIVYRWIFTSIETTNWDWNSDPLPIVVMAAMTIYSLIFLVALRLALNIYIGVKRCSETRWSVAFYVKAAAVVLQALAEIAVIVLIVIAARRDRREHVERDASHWCGVWLQFALSGFTILMTILGVVNMYLMFTRM